MKYGFWSDLIFDEIEDIVRKDESIAIAERFNIMMQMLPPYFWALTYGETVSAAFRRSKRFIIK